MKCISVSLESDTSKFPWFLETHCISYGSARLSEKCLHSVAFCSEKSSPAFLCGCKVHSLLFVGWNVQNLGRILQGYWILCIVNKSRKAHAKFLTRLHYTPKIIFIPQEENIYKVQVVIIWVIDMNNSNIFSRFFLKLDKGHFCLFLSQVFSL